MKKAILAFSLSVLACVLFLALDTNEILINDKFSCPSGDHTFRDGLPTPDMGQIVYCSTHLQVEPYDGSAWQDAPHARIKTGTYTGDGTTSMGVTGIGFQPIYVKIWNRKTADTDAVTTSETTDTIIDDNASGYSIHHHSAGTMEGHTDNIISLDADGFTVDDAGTDANPNKSGTVYNYMAMG